MPRLTVSAIALAAIALAACESNGHTRYASVGTVGQKGPPGAQGPQGPAGQDGQDGQDGAQGPAGPAGPQGEPGGNFATGDTGMIATGGLIGPSGVGGTGLLANLGDPSTSIPVVSDTASSGGTLLTSTATGIDTLIAQTDLPDEITSVTGAVTETVANVGDALTGFGENGEPLVDGVTGAVSPILTASLGGGTLAGDSDGSSLIGLSILSPEQETGTLAEVGVATDGTLLNLDLATGSDTALEVGDLASVDLGPVTDGVNDLLDTTGLSEVTDADGAVGGLLAEVTDPLNDLLSGDTGGLDDVADPVTDLLADATDPITDLLSGNADGLGDVAGPVEDLLSGDLGDMADLGGPVEDLVTGVSAPLSDLTDPLADLTGGDSEEDTSSPLDPITGGLLGLLGGGGR
ncbi:hypothetical protein K1X12_16340 [Hyphomonas sp. WL0036]|uniref:hypothetical protein n=1 Tax=Hyphomonas sediminis TaxID=2866160 RepID=UPI001C7F11A1|nr:hypothetical protein [Hyphomonas sediminis]MBY9068472.1 hypothetical protein [Hyphomonas sediminis]